MAFLSTMQNIKVTRRTKSIAATQRKSDIQQAIDSNENISELVIREVGDEAYDLISEYIDLDEGKTFVASTTTRFNIDKIPSCRNTFSKGGCATFKKLKGKVEKGYENLWE